MPKIKKKRVGFVLDMTPLVDIGFLLLTFFMFTAKFKSEAEAEQKFVIERPTASADTSKVPENNLATIKIGVDTVYQDTSYYYSLSNENVRLTVWDQQENLTDEMRQKRLLKVPLETLDGLIRNTRAASVKTRFAIDADRSIEYKWIEDLMDVMQRNNATAFNFVTEKKQ